MTKHWFTSDLHVGHANIVTFCNRPYGIELRPGFRHVTPADIEAMNMDLVRRWNSVVAPEDEVTVVGDVCMGRLDDSLALIGLLNGTKRLIPGNHDRMFGCQGTKYANTVQRYLDAGFAEVLEEQVWIDDMLVCHFPYAGDSQDGHEDRFQEKRPVDHGALLIHGHTHGKWRRSGHMIDVGVDAWGGYPVSLEEIVALFKSDKIDASPLPW